ncbi:MAG: hypothetical protein B7Y25_03595 [Alphaproteobacteria bacterium 16-39-46]|nr:MAG: hypothetical protein B7Y25_03595 [Alphaproteobacteria bacterium 16-39-46]OZA43244.1 MAG: hypothetical protein B7X84_03820 [Alphaproteobacteria bacterium 17-39-52]HQS84000.1 hypothetical protein [Alphaproteobacteria bacterium]HQS93859.1 hypothetical protein [Alphaproteobacteria bacterium]
MRKYVFLSLSTVFVLGVVSVCPAMEEPAAVPPSIKKTYIASKKRKSEEAHVEHVAFLDAHPELKAAIVKPLNFVDEVKPVEEAPRKFLRGRFSRFQPPLNFPTRSLSGASSVTASDSGAGPLSPAGVDLKGLRI